MIEKSCFFIGHRESGDEIYPALLECVARAADEYGIESFFCGTPWKFRCAGCPRGVREQANSAADQAVAGAERLLPGVEIPASEEI